MLPFGEIRPLLTRLRNLPREAPEAPKDRPRNALIAEADRTRRTVVARVLRNAGYAVTFAVTSEDAASFSERADLSLAVINSELMPTPARSSSARAAPAATPTSSCAARRAICAPAARACWI